MRDSSNTPQSSRIPRAILPNAIHRRLILTQDQNVPTPHTSTYPIITVASGSADGIEDELTTSFQHLEIDSSSEPILTPKSYDTRPSSPANTYRLTAIMNSGDMMQTFDGVNPKRSEVRMYIQSAEKRAMYMANGQDQDGLSQLIFYNGLRGAAK